MFSKTKLFLDIANDTKYIPLYKTEKAKYFKTAISVRFRSRVDCCSASPSLLSRAKRIIVFNKRHIIIQKNDLKKLKLTFKTKSATAHVVS